MKERHAEPPLPEEVTSAADYVAALKRLRVWSGLTYRQVEAKARARGEVLPASTTATMLGRRTLPREQLVVAFTRACGLGEEDVERWVAARRRLAMDPAEPEDPRPEPEPDDRPTGRRWLRWWPVAAAVSAAAVGAVAASAVLTGSELPEDGWYRLRPAHVADRDLCLGEGRERNQRTDRPLAVQRPCQGLVPDTYLESLGSGVYLIKWRSDQEGWGCLSVDDASLEDETLIAPRTCTGAAHERFLLEPVDTPVPGGFVLRPVHSGKCVGVLGGPADVDAGAEATQSSCSGKADQEFLLERVDR
ncbi:hypothetical protein JOF41_002306 [Saccharothrix coeruleofusca]|uniref:XRE family transcriptional regulator n=1 Tax=Saccharothrix coeruleofusca TaxID=33919 RepID=UPI001AE3E3C4|nr:XRE family transcriptional regulator [Saccharothrix coeruleofusca]MBP2336128.1 hypothetical protein [Saccharothrix coeruleofusca]